MGDLAERDPRLPVLSAREDGVVLSHGVLVDGDEEAIVRTIEPDGSASESGVVLTSIA